VPAFTEPGKPFVCVVVDGDGVTSENAD
jgi:hypothetical protein